MKFSRKIVTAQDLLRENAGQKCGKQIADQNAINVVKKPSYSPDLMQWEFFIFSWNMLPVERRHEAKFVEEVNCFGN